MPAASAVRWRLRKWIVSVCSWPFTVRFFIFRRAFLQPAAPAGQFPDSGVEQMLKAGGVQLLPVRPARSAAASRFRRPAQAAEPFPVGHEARRRQGRRDFADFLFIFDLVQQADVVADADDIQLFADLHQLDGFLLADADAAEMAYGPRPRPELVAGR